MKVLHVIPSVGPLRGGPSFVMHAMAKGLAERGCDVHIATTDDNGHGRLSVTLSLPVRQGAVTYWYFRRQTRFYTFSWPLFRWLKAHLSDFDLVHIHSLFSFAAISAAFWAGHYRVPYVVRPLGTLNRWGLRNRRYWLKRMSLRFIDLPALRGAAAVHYTSEQEREEASSVTQGNSVVIPNPVDFDQGSGKRTLKPLRSHYPELAGKNTVLFLSRLDPTKGIDLLLAAFALLSARRSNVALILAGTGEEGFVRALHEKSRNLGIESDVVWTGFVAGEQKAALLAEGDVFVLPSYSENFGVAVVEALAAGLPVIVSDRVGIQREIAVARAGLVVPCSAEHLADAVGLLLDNAPRRLEMAENGKRLAESFSCSKVSGQLIELYCQLAQPATVAPC